MNAFFALVVLGIVQGLTEFLPVSSSGHLVLLSRLFGIEDSLFVSIILHVATLLSVLVVLRKQVLSLIRHPFSAQSKKLIATMLPTLAIVLALYPFITDSFEGAILPLCFLASAVILIVTDFVMKKKRSFQGEITYKQALVMGAVQGLATMPGISRSGSTICSGLLAGGDKENVAQFSFLMSIPIILGSMCLEVIRFVKDGASIAVNIPGLVAAFIVAFAIGVLALKIMLSVTKNLNFKWFGVYLVALSIISFFVR